MMLVRCYIGRSEIEGLGVFAAETIPAGTEVWRFTPGFDILISKENLANAPTPTREYFAHYAYEIASHPGHMALDCDDGRFMNHSPTPNLDFSVPGVATAIVTIPAHAEITCDYNLIASEPFEMEPSRNRV
jgi:SET domain-containing protein